MQTLSYAQSVVNTPSDTGWDKFSKATPPYLDAAIADDCKADIAAMRAASRADAEQAETYLIEANALHERIIDRQRHINAYCTFLLKHGRASQ